MGWITVLAFAAVALALLWRYGRLSRTEVELAAAALVLGIVGYAWQGTPGEPGHPLASLEKPGVVDETAIASRRAMMGQFGTDAQWLDLADTMSRMGQTQTAVLAMRSGLRDNPNSPELWVGLGNALVAHGDGLVSPSAQFAFQHAARLSPKHPGPPFFFGLALAQQGRTEDAMIVWRGLLARTPADAPWRSDLVARLAALGVAIEPATP